MNKLFLKVLLDNYLPIIIYIYIQSKLDNSTLTGRSFNVELASMLSYRMYKLMT